jgi:hypothetical protein
LVANAPNTAPTIADTIAALAGTPSIKETV